MIQTLPPPTMEIETKTQKASIDHLPTILTRHDICEQFKIPVSNNWYYLNKHVLTDEVIKEIGYTRRQLQHIRTFSKLNSHHRPMFYWLAKTLKEWK